MLRPSGRRFVCRPALPGNSRPQMAVARQNQTWPLPAPLLFFFSSRRRHTRLFLRKEFHRDGARHSFETEYLPEREELQILLARGRSRHEAGGSSLSGHPGSRAMLGLGGCSHSQNQFGGARSRPRLVAAGRLVFGSTRSPSSKPITTDASVCSPAAWIACEMQAPSPKSLS